MFNLHYVLVFYLDSTLEHTNTSRGKKIGSTYRTSHFFYYPKNKSSILDPVDDFLL